MKEWLEALQTAGVPCAVASSLDRFNLLAALQRMGLYKYFQVAYGVGNWIQLNSLSQIFIYSSHISLFMQAVITHEDGMNSMAHRFLSAAVKVVETFLCI